MNHKILAIDCSINNIGWCLWDGTMKFGTFKSKGNNEYEKLTSITQFITESIKEHQPTHAVVEKPPVYTYARSTSKWTGKGLNASAIQKLNWSYGAILTALSLYGIPTDTPLPEEYKPKYNRGRMVICMSYHDIRQILDAQFKDLKCNEHEAHAIYLCLWKKHRLKLEGMKVG